jgi:predicted MFS family arabinose efflux permease
VGFVALAFLLANRHVLRESAADVALRKAPATGSVFAFLRSPLVWMCFTFFFFTVMAFGILQNFSVPVFERSYGATLALATSALTAYLLGSAVGTGAGGFFTRGGAREERLVALSLLVVLLGALTLASGAAPQWALVPVMGMMGFAAGFSGPSRDLLIRRAATSTHGPQAVGRISGFVYSGIDLGLATAPLLFGLLMDAGRYLQVIAGVALLQGLAIATALTVGIRARR